MDNASGALKASLYKMMDAKNTSKWISLLPKAVEAHNSRNHSTIQAPPRSVESNEVLSHLLLTANSAKARHNVQVFLKTKKGLEIRSPFRAPIPDKRIRSLRRGFQARMSSKVYKVTEILQDGRQVEAETGEVFSIKLVKAVPEGSWTVPQQGLARALQQRQQNLKEARQAKK